MWRVQVWQGHHIVEAKLVQNESLARAAEEELRRKYPAPEYQIKLEEDEGEPWWSGPSGRGVMPTGGPINIPYVHEPSEGDESDLEKARLEKSQRENRFSENLTWWIVRGISRTVFRLLDLVRGRR